MKEWGPIVDPPADGRTKLALRLDRAIEEECAELRGLRTASGVLALLIAAYAGWPTALHTPGAAEAAQFLASTRPSADTRILVAEGDSVALPPVRGGVRMYWLFR